MHHSASNPNTTNMPNQEVVLLAKKLLKELENGVQPTGKRVFKDAFSTPYVKNVLMLVFSELAEGHAVSVVPSFDELSTQEAADMLNVSRPYLITLLESGKIPFRKVGTKRRVLTEDVLRYKKAIDDQRLKTLDELAQQAQELDLGY